MAEPPPVGKETLAGDISAGAHPDTGIEDGTKKSDIRRAQINERWMGCMKKTRNALF